MLSSASTLAIGKEVIRDTILVSSTLPSQIGAASHPGTHCTVALVFIDDSDDLMRQHSLCQKLTDCGCHVVITAFRSKEMLTTASMESAGRMLRERRPRLLWLSPKSFALGSPTRHDRRRSYATATLVQWQLNDNRLVLMESSAGSTIWEIGGWEQLTHDGRLQSRIVKWCRLGITHSASGLPSRKTSRLLTNINLVGDFSTCDCTQHHQQQYLTQGQQRDEQRDFISRLSGYLVDHVVTNVGRPLETVPLSTTVGVPSNSDASYPTEARLRQKQREAQHGKTIVKKNLNQYEKHDDDCGYDLSSIHVDGVV